MPFGNITVNTVTYEPRQPGYYSKSGLSFADPTNEFRLRGGSVNKNGQRTCNVSRVLQKDVTVSGNTVRKQASVSVTVIVDDGPHFTPAELDGLASDISEFLTTSTVSRLMVGEQ